MAIVQTQCTVFKYNLLNGLEDFNAPTPYTYKIALYTANANLNASTTAYITDNEVVGVGYTAGGKTLTVVPPAYSGATAYISFGNISWTGASFTTRGALIYNATTGAAVAVLNFGSDKQAGPNFNITFPTADAANAILRIS